MKTEQYQWSSQEQWQPNLPEQPRSDVQLVWLFGSRERLASENLIQAVASVYPNACLFGCSTAGEICNTHVYDDSLIVTAVQFEKTTIQSAFVDMSVCENAFDAGKIIAEKLNAPELKHLFVLSDGLVINGSDLVRGIIGHLPESVSVTGGLSGDGELFQKTTVLAEGKPKSGYIAAIGFYGAHLQVGHGSLGGWDPFGPERLITRSSGNILYELDGKSALSLYKKYLGNHADGLPATGLLFPLSLRNVKNEDGLVRTILAVDEASQSMTFAGDMPEGSYARLMKANFDRLIDGAVGAARMSHQTLGHPDPDFAILISCVGRKMVLKQRVEEEVEGARDILGQKTILTGFYSYGEISPFSPNVRCVLHNQTMTITTFKEV